ncbi:hypothetical protein N7G274_005094 [Stereocaulon virgatum]|uniref:Uncharacterized protein n=1 Tax=Stereocaulon virgatum TaxID=373712 RepID=A0ABR4A7M3_9LECA
MRLNLGSVAGNMPIAYFPSAAAHTELMAPYYSESEIIASLTNFESMDDDELYEATARAQGALLHWQNEFYDLDDQVYQAANGSYQREPLFGNPRPAITTKPISTKTALARTTNLSMDVRATGGELEIDMNDALVPKELPAKRVRKAPTVFDSLPPPAPTATKRKRQEPDIVESIDTESHPPATKRATRAPKIKTEESTAPEPSTQRPTRARSVAQPDPAVPESSAAAATATRRPARARPATNPESEPVAPEPSAPIRRSTRSKSITKAPEPTTTTTTNRVSKTPAAPAPKKRATRAKSATEEPSAAPEASGKDPKRSAAMKLSWAKRKAAGTNGRNGGAPAKSGVAKKGGK